VLIAIEKEMPRKILSLIKEKVFFLHKDKSLSNIVKFNILSSLIIKIINVLISILLVSVTLSYLGVEKYGIWISLAAIISWSKLVDIGIGNGLRNELAKSIAVDNLTDAKIYISTAYITLNVIAIFLFFVISYALLFVDLNLIINSQLISSSDLYKLAVLSLFFTLFDLSTNIINQVANAIQKNFITELNRLTCNVFAIVILSLVQFLLPNNILLPTIILGFSAIISNLIITIWIFSQNKELTPSKNHFRFYAIKNILGLGVNFFIIQIAVLVYMTTDKLVIINVLGPQYVTEYDLVYKIFALTSIITASINSSLWSAYTNAFFKKDLASRPKAFSALSVVLDSGVSMPANLTLEVKDISNPRSISTSIVSPSTTLLTFLT
jgi:O-antigen/teichoic acid export membrane protein